MAYRLLDEPRQSGQQLGHREADDEADRDPDIREPAADSQPESLGTGSLGICCRIWSYQPFLS
jgi:hypothetical protein